MKPLAKMADLIRIYKIQSCDTGCCYIGSTEKELAERLYFHEQQTRAGINPCLSRKIIEGGNYDIHLLEECTPATFREREAFHIKRNRKICVNRNTPWTSADDGWERRTKYQKTGIEAESAEEYRKKYIELNQERRRQYNKNYFNTNRDKLLEKHQCQLCGGSYSQPSQATHNATKKHQKALAARAQQNTGEIDQAFQEFKDNYMNATILSLDPPLSDYSSDEST